MKVIEINNKNADELGFFELYYQFAIMDHWREESLKPWAKTYQREKAEYLYEYHSITFQQMVESLPHKYKANFKTLEDYYNELYK